MIVNICEMWLEEETNEVISSLYIDLDKLSKDNITRKKIERTLERDKIMKRDNCTIWKLPEYADCDILQDNECVYLCVEFTNKEVVDALVSLPCNLDAVVHMYIGPVIKEEDVNGYY